MTVRSSTWLLLLGTAGCAVMRSQPQPIEVARAFTIPIAAADHTIEVRVPCGAVVIAHSDAASCEVQARAIGASAEEADALAAQISKVADDEPDGTVVVQLSMPANADLSTRVVVALQAPPHILVRVLTRRAMVAVHGFQGALEVDSEVGSVSARLGGGSIHARTVSGAIRVHGSFASARIHTDTGAARLTVPATADALAVDVETTSGDIDLEFAPGVAAKLDVRTRSGRPIVCDLPVEWTEHGLDDGQRWHRFAGRIGAAAAAPRQISIVTESGRIGLRTLPGS